jgi:hypothetical protein
LCPVPPTYASLIAGIIATPRQAHWLKWGLAKFLYGLALYLDPTSLWLPSS